MDSGLFDLDVCIFYCIYVYFIGFGYFICVKKFLYGNCFVYVIVLMIFGFWNERVWEFLFIVENFWDGNIILLGDCKEWFFDLLYVLNVLIVI